MSVDSAIIYTQDGDIAMIVHVDNEPDDIAEAKITTDPAFNPDWGIQTRMPRDVYDSCAAGTPAQSYYNIMQQTVAILNGTLGVQTGNDTDSKQTKQGGSLATPLTGLASAIQANLDAIDAANQAIADATAQAIAAFNARQQTDAQALSS